MVAVAFRQALAGHVEWSVRNHLHFHYGDVRPVPVNEPPRHLPVITDGFGFVVLMAKWAGAGDPAGKHFSGLGTIGDILQSQQRVPLQGSLPADLAVFGDWPGEHVVILLEDGHVGDPLVASFAFEGGPVKHRLSVESSWFSRRTPLTFLRLPG